MSKTIGVENWAKIDRLGIKNGAFFKNNADRVSGLMSNNLSKGADMNHSLISIFILRFQKNGTKQRCKS